MAVRHLATTLAVRLTTCGVHAWVTMHEKNLQPERTWCVVGFGTLCGMMYMIWHVVRTVLRTEG